MHLADTLFIIVYTHLRKSMSAITEYQFLVYLLVYASHVDNRFTLEEKNLIEGHFGVEDTQKMIEVYNNLKVNERDTFIIDNIDYFIENYAIKEYLDKLLKELYEVDGEFCRFERTFHAFMSRLFKYT